MASTSWAICSARLEFTAKYKLPVQFDTAIQINLTNETHRDEDDASTKIATLPTGLLAVRVFGCISLSGAEFKIDDDIAVYARVIAGPLGKSTRHVPFSKGKPIWNECLFFPVMLTGNPKSTLCRLTILIIWRDVAQDRKSAMSNHKLLGKAEFLLHKMAKHIRTFETIDISNRKQQIVGQLQVEMALIYGTFGFGLSHQLENHLHTPEEQIKASFYPKVSPSHEGPQYGGHAVIPRNITHPKIIPFNQKATQLEPPISDTYGKQQPVTSMMKFPTLSAAMTRLAGLQVGLLQQKTRTKRIAYLRGVLRSLDKFDLDEDVKTKNLKKPSEKSSGMKTTLENETELPENNKLEAINEDEEHQEDSHALTAPKFVESLQGMDQAGTPGASGRSSVSSLYSIEFPPEYYTRRHYRKSSLLSALFTGKAQPSTENI